MAQSIFKALAGITLLVSSAASFAFGGAPASADIDNTAIGNHQQTWEYKALAKQNLLDNAVPLSQGFQVMGHNAYNSTAYSSIVHIDPNHTLSITELLNLGVRTVEMDYHWVHQMKDIPHGGALLMCHAGDNDVGCGGLERYLHEGVEEVNSWLRKNPKEVLVLYFQDDAEGHDSELKKSVSSIDDLIYKQPAGQCKNFSEMVKTISEEDVLKAGKQVIIMGSSCSGRGAWDGYSWNSIHNWVSGGPQSIIDKSEADCLADTGKQDGAHRIWEDLTNLSAAFGDPGPGISASVAAKAGRCGIGALSLDKITIGDSRMKASIWSWAENEPSGGDSQDCGFVRDNGRYYDGNCSSEGSYYACSSSATSWKVTASYGDWVNGDARCKAEFGSSYSFSMPTNSQQNEWLKVAMNGKAHAWVNYTDSAEEGLWLTPAHTVDYGDGTAKLTSLKAGLSYEFFMRTTHNSCELQWQGGNEGSGERNAKFDCLSKGDAMKFVPDAAPQTAADGAVSIHGRIFTSAGGYNCGLEWDGGISGGERNAKFDCSGSADPLTIISKSNGTTERVIIKSDNNCGLQWAGGDADGNGERNAKFDCDPAYDDMTLYGVKLPVEYRELKVMGVCMDTSNSAANGNNVFVHACWNPAGWQKWTYEVETGFIKNKANPHMCLDSTNGNAAGTSVKMWACEDHINLKWDFVGTTIRPRKNHNLALDVKNGDPFNGQDLWLWDANANAAQVFSWGDL